MNFLHRLLFLLPFLFCSLFAAPRDSLPERLREHIRYSEDQPNLIGHIYIGGHDTQISQGTWVYVKNALDAYKTLKPIFIILELDTPGGQVFPAQKISDALKEMDIQHDIPVVAFINNWAISAGAMLAYSSRFIAAVKDASMGAAQPIMQTGEKASEKVNSAIRADFANRAAFFDRDPLLAEAMVDPDLILVLRDGFIVKLDREDQILPADLLITAKGKLLTLNSKEMMELGVADLRLLPEKLPPLTRAEKREGVWPASKSLLFTYPFFKKIPNAVVHSYQMDWKTRFLAFISSPLVTSLLFLGLMFSIYFELNTPGFGAAGVIGIICLALIVLSSFALEVSGWLEVIILAIGIGLILIEIFVIPGFGITGILGIILALGGLFALLLPGIKEIDFDFDTQTFNAAGQYFLRRLAWLVGTFVVGFILIAVLARFLAPRLALFSPLVLRGEQEGYAAGLSKEELPPVGAVGTAASPLRTAGRVLIADELYDAVSSGGFIEKGKKIKVIGVQGSKIIVEEVSESI